MRSLASLLLLAAPLTAQEPPHGDGPRGSSQREEGERRLDEVGHAKLGASLAVRGLANGSAIELTALDSGKTIVAAATAAATANDPLVTLSPAAAAALVLPAGGVVRVRQAVVSPQEQVQLSQGGIVKRIDAPLSLLAGLRKRAPLAAAENAPSAKPTREERRAARPAAAVATRSSASLAASAAPTGTGSFWVQVASLSSEASARTLAARVGGTVSPIGKLYRVRIGPLSDRGSAQRAQARAASLGYRDATIVKPD